MNKIKPRSALISVSDKTGIVKLSTELIELGITLYASGGTAKHLRQNDVAVTKLESITDYPEMIDGRVKTLQPAVHAGILGERDRHREQLNQHNWPWFDIVICHLYPFEEATRSVDNQHYLLDYIDIGGPAMLRAAAKNHRWVTAIGDTADYDKLLTEIKQNQGVTWDFRQQMAAKVFHMSAYYDAVIAQQLTQDVGAEPTATIAWPWRQQAQLRYGENPHQKAVLYQKPCSRFVWQQCQLQGQTMSYNNYLDAQAALDAIREFDEPASVIVKHTNCCGAAQNQDIIQAFENAWQGDSQAAFGGIVALNRPCEQSIAQFLTKRFVELIIAPEFSQQALQQFANKKNLRLLQVPNSQLNQTNDWYSRQIDEGLLLQRRNDHQLTAHTIQTVTQNKPTGEQLSTMVFGWRVLKHLHSNAIVIAKGERTIGIGAGCVARIDAVNMAINKASDELVDAVVLSDGFFPFPDAIERIATAGIRTIVQPGGSKNDQQIIDACRHFEITLVFTGIRCFSH
jgi:phosphoribosylaminoimidazolecarboxamide formyltransferase/IMP cyclohydrolase